MTCQESWSSGKKSGQCVVAGTGHGVIPKYVFVCLAPVGTILRNGTERNGTE